MLGFKPRIEDMDDELETVASPQEALVRYLRILQLVTWANELLSLFQSTDSEGSRPSSPDLTKSLKGATGVPMPLIGASAAIAVLGIVLSYIYLT